MTQTPASNCPLCPRLAGFRAENQAKYPGWHNAPVPSFGQMDAELLVVGLAPGLKGANRTGRPFTGDYAGLVLYSGLKKNGFAEGTYAERADDGFTLINCRITNAVRCVPPENKPEPSEIKACIGFLKEEIMAMHALKAVIALGTVAHASVVRVLGDKPAARPFAHGAIQRLGHITLFDSYHCSRYNINTGRLTQAMFDAVVEKAKTHLIL